MTQTRSAPTTPRSTTLQRVEAGDTNVGIGIYAGVFRALGLLDGLSRIADNSNDRVGRALASADLDEGTGSLDQLEAASQFFGLTLAQARAIIKEVATASAIWRDTAKGWVPRPAEINRMASAFEHDDLKRALAL